MPMLPLSWEKHLLILETSSSSSCFIAKHEEEEEEEEEDMCPCYDFFCTYDGYTSNEYEEDATKMLNKEEEEECVASEEFEMSGIMSKLPIEIFFDILSRLPIESLSHCRWVSKAWYNAIKDPCFIELQHTKVIHDNCYCVIFYDKFEVDYHLVSNEDLEALETVAIPHSPSLPRPLCEMHSCNGLVFSAIQPYFISNPVTGEYIVIPKPPRYAHVDVVTGFGFDPVSKVFKIIRIIQDTEEFETSAEVYNVGTGKWRLISKVPYSFKGTKSNVFVNGALHWIGSPCVKTMDSEVIVSFKLDTEEFQQVLLPPTPPPSRSLRSHFLSDLFASILRRFSQYLAVLDECLCIVRTFNNENIEIWMMKEYGFWSSWVSKYTVRYIKWEGEPVRGPYKPLQLLKNGHLLLLCSQNEMGYYDSYENRLEIISTEAGLYADSVLQPLLHVGSLISPKASGKLRKSESLDGGKHWY